ncbi:MAG: MOFRL family protein, partial [Myxococcota bacterium]
AGSDGIDGSSPAAGAVVDGDTWATIAEAGVDPQRALDRCASHTALTAIGAPIITGPTGVNHADLVAILAA